MKTFAALFLLMSGLSSIGWAAPPPGTDIPSPISTPGMEGTVYGFTADSIQGKPVTLSRYRGKVLLIVNVASKCGFTPQYAGLEALYKKYEGRGFVILGFPCNQFKEQEPGTAAQIVKFCKLNYGVTFPLFAKIQVNGPGTHPLYAFLKKAEPDPQGKTDIGWNFTKFLIGRDGRPLERFVSQVTPEKLAPEVERALASPTAAPAAP